MRTNTELKTNKPFTALRRRAEASFSAMRGNGRVGRRGWKGVTVIGELKLLSALADSAQPKQAIIRRNDHVRLCPIARRNVTTFIRRHGALGTPPPRRLRLGQLLDLHTPLPRSPLPSLVPRPTLPSRATILVSPCSPLFLLSRSPTVATRTPSFDTPTPCPRSSLARPSPRPRMVSLSPVPTLSRTFDALIPRSHCSTRSSAAHRIISSSPPRLLCDISPVFPGLTAHRPFRFAQIASAASLLCVFCALCRDGQLNSECLNLHPGRAVLYPYHTLARRPCAARH